MVVVTHSESSPRYTTMATDDMHFSISDTTAAVPTSSSTAPRGIYATPPREAKRPSAAVVSSPSLPSAVGSTAGGDLAALLNDREAKITAPRAPTGLALATNEDGTLIYEASGCLRHCCTHSISLYDDNAVSVELTLAPNTPLLVCTLGLFMPCMLCCADAYFHPSLLTIRMKANEDTSSTTASVWPHSLLRGCTGSADKFAVFAHLYQLIVILHAVQPGSLQYEADGVTMARVHHLLEHYATLPTIRQQPLTTTPTLNQVLAIFKQL